MRGIIAACVYIARRTSSAFMSIRRNVARGSDRLPVEAVNIPWAILPTDVVSVLVSLLDSSDIPRLRLVCTAWSYTIDAVLEDLELVSFPEDVDWVSKFPVIKSLKIVKPGRSGSASPRMPIPPSPGTEAATASQPATPYGSCDSLLKLSSNRPAPLPLLPVEDEGSVPSPAGPSDALPASLSSRRHLPVLPTVFSADLDTNLSPPSTPMPSPCWPLPCPSPVKSEQLSSLLRGLRGRSVPVRSLSLFHDGGDASQLSSLPYGLTSLIVVSLANEKRVQAAAAAAAAPDGGPAGQGGAGGELGLAAGAAAAAATMFDSVAFPAAAIDALQELRELKMVNGLPDITALASLPHLTKLSLTGEPPVTSPGKRQPVCFHRQSCGLGSELSLLVNLTDLVVQKARLVSLPSELSVLQNLTSMHFSDCNLKTLPAEVIASAFYLAPKCMPAECAGAGSALLQQHSHRASITSLQNLTLMHFPDCNLKTLPAEVGQLQRLRRLSCAGNPNLKLPNSLADVRSLRYLNLSWTQSNVGEVFEQASGTFQALEELKLTGNAIKQLPATIGNLACLKVLVLSVNQLHQLPEEMSALTALTHLDLSLNSITVVQNLPPGLVRLNLQGNSLTQLPDDLGVKIGGKILWLDISNNGLTHLPHSLGRCSKLQMLRLSFNQLQDIPRKLLSKLVGLRLLEAYHAGPASGKARPVLMRLRQDRPRLSVAC